MSFQKLGYLFEIWPPKALALWPSGAASVEMSSSSPRALRRAWRWARAGLFAGLT